MARTLILAGKTRTLPQGRCNVSFDDIQAVAALTLRHRLILGFEAEADGITTDPIIVHILKDLPRNSDAVEGNRGTGQPLYWIALARGFASWNLPPTAPSGWD